MSNEARLTKDDIELFGRLVEDHGSFLLTTHVNCDGDGLGSEYALYDYLAGLGKKVRIVNPTHCPEVYGFLNEKGLIEHFKVGMKAEDFADIDAVLMCDFSSWKRLGPLVDIFERLSAPKIYLDHHLGADDRCDGKIILDSASATGEIVFDLISNGGNKLTYEMALGIYVALLTDTGSFRHIRDRHRVHAIAAETIQAGVSPPDVYHWIYEQNSLSRMQFLGYCLQKLQVAADGRLAWVQISRDEMNRFNVKSEEMEGFVDMTREIKGVEIGVMFTEMVRGEIKASFRSNRRYTVNDLAGQFGGGGHYFAAGATVNLPIDEVVEKVVAAALEKLQGEPQNIVPVREKAAAPK